MRTFTARQPIRRFFSTATRTSHLHPVVSIKEGNFSVENNERSALARFMKPNLALDGWGGFRKIDYDPSTTHVVFHEFNQSGFFAVVVNFSALFNESPRLSDVKEQFGIGVTMGTKEEWNSAGRNSTGVRKQMRETGFTTRWIPPQEVMQGIINDFTYHGVAVRPFILEEGPKEVEFYFDARHRNLVPGTLRVHELVIFELSKEEYEAKFGIENTKRRYTLEGAEKIKAGSAVIAAEFHRYKASQAANLTMDIQPTSSVGKHM